LGEVNFTSSTYDQTTDILLTGRRLTVWKIAVWLSKKDTSKI